MAFAISAFFPLGFYQGSDSGGRPESYPSPSRLYSALVFRGDHEHVRSLVADEAGLQGLDVFVGRRRVAEVDFDVGILFFEFVDERLHDLLVVPAQEADRGLARVGASAAGSQRQQHRGAGRRCHRSGQNLAHVHCVPPLSRASMPFFRPWRHRREPAVESIN